MKFSILNLLLLTLLVAFVTGCLFTFPEVGHLLLTLFAVSFVGPSIVIGVIHARGFKRSFFVGALVPTIPYYVICTFVLVDMSYQGWWFGGGADGTTWIHGCSIGVICIGGFWGTVSHKMLVNQDANDNPEK